MDFHSAFHKNDTLFLNVNCSFWTKSTAAEKKDGILLYVPWVSVCVYGLIRDRTKKKIETSACAHT